MCSRALGSLMLMGLLVTSAGEAQDPTRVAPEHYRLAFENEHVQVVYVHYGPHEQSALHDHSAGVVVNVTDGHLRFTDENGRTQEVLAMHGEARWFPALKHRVQNLGNTSYDGVYIAIKDNPSHRTISGRSPIH